MVCGGEVDWQNVQIRMYGILCIDDITRDECPHSTILEQTIMYRRSNLTSLMITKTWESNSHLTKGFYIVGL